MKKLQPKPNIEELVLRLFDEQKYNSVEYSGEYEYFENQADITLKDNGVSTIVNIKQYSPKSPPNLEIFQKALETTDQIRQKSKAEKAILIITCDLNERSRNIAKLHPEIDIWDLKIILEKADYFDGLRKQFSMLLKLPDIPQSLPTFKENKKLSTIISSINSNLKTSLEEGKNLAIQIKTIAPGRESATEFEKACIKCLKYLFDGDIVGWHEQSTTIDNLNRRDLICRIDSTVDIWNLISTNLNSRYIVFEFKNYTDEITQQEIITTERYLYPTALRNTAIIISPKGSSESAKKIIEGAMREHGKLIISLTVDEICKLLTGKDVGDDPNVFLFNKVDEFLMSLSR